MKRLHQPPTLETALRDYIIDRRVRPDTAEAYRHKLNKYTPDLMCKRLHEITQEEVVARHAEISLSAPSVAAFVFKAIRAVFNFSVHYYSNLDGHSFSIRNPTLILTARKSWSGPSAVAVGLDLREIGMYYHAFRSLPSETACDLLLFCLLTGVPAREATKLKWNDVSLSQCTVTIHECNGDGNHERCRTLPLATPVARLLANRAHYVTSQAVFPAQHSTEPLATAYPALKSLRARRGIHVTPQDLVSTFLNIAMSSEIPMEDRPPAPDRASVERTIKHLQRSDPERLRPLYEHVAEYIMRKADETRSSFPEPKRARKGPAKVCSIHQPCIATPF